MAIPTTAGQDQAVRNLARMVRATQAAPAPLPLVREDPSIVAGYEVQNQYTAAAQAARAAFGLTDIQRAEGILRAWKTASDQLAVLYRDLQQRRHTRAEWIEAQLPIGPGIPADASDADRAVLMSAFNTARAVAGAATADQRTRMLNDAERFGDDVTKRAVLTTSIDDNQWDLVDRWAEMHSPETGALLKEWVALQEALDGRGFDHAWVRQALHQPRRPAEYHELPRLISAHNAQVLAFNQSRNRGNAPAQDLIALDSTLL